MKTLIGSPLRAFADAPSAAIGAYSPVSKRQRAFGAAVAAVVLVSAGLALRFGFARVDTVEDESYEARLREVAQLDRKVNVDVLEARFGVIHDYDGVAASERDLVKLGGVIHVHSARGQGTRVEIRVPAHLDRCARTGRHGSAGRQPRVESGLPG